MCIMYDLCWSGYLVTYNKTSGGSFLQIYMKRNDSQSEKSIIMENMKRNFGSGIIYLIQNQIGSNKSAVQ